MCFSFSNHITFSIIAISFSVIRNHMKQMFNLLVCWYTIGTNSLSIPVTIRNLVGTWTLWSHIWNYDTMVFLFPFSSSHQQKSLNECHGTHPSLCFCCYLGSVQTGCSEKWLPCVSRHKHQKKNISLLEF